MIKLILPLVLIVGIIGGVYLVQSRVNLFPQAATGAFQEKVVVSNLAPTSLVISYFTASPSADFIQYGENTDVPNQVLDARENGSTSRLNTHYFKLSDLKPSTKYYFKINTRGKLLPENEYLTFETPGAARGTPSQEEFRGTIKKGGGEVPLEGIVFLSSDNGQLLSAPMEKNGGWGITYNGMRTADMSRYLDIDEAEQIEFLAYAGGEGFGMFGEYALKQEGIDIEIDEGRVPFYKINLGQQPTNSSSAQGDEQTIWVQVSDFLKGAF